MTQSLVSCIIPTFNSARTLAQTLLSLQAQTDIQLEIIIVDSGSTDTTLQIAERFGVRVEYVPAGNMYAAINHGWRLARGEWLSYLNSDDGLFGDSYARLLHRAGATQADIVYGNCDYVDGGGRFVYSFAAAQPAQLPALFRCERMGFAQPTALFARRVLLDLNGFAEAYRYKADADFFMRALERQFRFALVTGPAVAWFRLHADQLSNRKAAEIADEGARLFGQAAWQPQLTDRLTLWQWQLRNLPHYAMRVLRASLLAKRLRLPRAQGSYEFPTAE